MFGNIFNKRGIGLYIGNYNTLLKEIKKIQINKTSCVHELEFIHC